MKKLFSSITRAGWKRGRQGSRGWMAVGVGTWVLRKAVEAIRKSDQPVETIRMKPGETLEISTATPLTKKQRKATKAASRRSK